MRQRLLQSLLKCIPLSSPSKKYTPIITLLKFPMKFPQTLIIHKTMRDTTHHYSQWAGMWNVAKSHLKTYIPTIQSRMVEVFSTGCSPCLDHVKNGLSLNRRESMLTVEVKSVSKEGKIFSRRNRTIRRHQNKHMILCTRLVCIDIHVGEKKLYTFYVVCM